MSIRVPFAPGEVKILEALGRSKTKRMMKSYTTLRGETSLPDPVLSDYLKRLMKKRLIERDIDTRKYLLSVDGIRKLQMLVLIERLMAIIEEEQTKPVKYKSEELRSTKLASGTRKNLRMLANCTYELHRAFLQLPKVQRIFGPNPFVRTEKLDDGTILLDFESQKG